jgi:hypothetical protein
VDAANGSSTLDVDAISFDSPSSRSVSAAVSRGAADNFEVTAASSFSSAACEASSSSRDFGTLVDLNLSLTLRSSVWMRPASIPPRFAESAAAP